MKILLSCLSILSATCLFAQQKQIITRDTINIHGYIYDNAGKGVNFMRIESTQLETEHNTFRLGTFTNERGYFELKGAKFNDTLTLGPDINYSLSPYYNRGSRSLIINLPAPKVVDITASAPLLISQKRKYPRAVPSFSVTPAEIKASTVMDMEDAKYPGGMEQLMAMIKQTVQYPESALKANFEGLVQVNFTITKDGYVRDIKVLRGLSEGIDDEVVRALKKSAKWEPAYNHGQAVATQKTILLEFKLTDS